MGAQVTDDLQNDIETWISSYVRSGKIPFGHVVICNASEVLLDTKQGYKDIDQSLLINDDYLLRIYSITKPIVTIAFMQLLEQGLVGLEDCVTEYIPEFSNISILSDDGAHKTRKNPITMRQLLTHSAGFSYGYLEDPVAMLYKEAQIDFAQGGTLQQQCAALAKMPLLFEPGTSWNYSVSIDVIGRVIEIVSGLSLNEYMSSNVLAPAGMNETAFVVTDERKKDLVTLYSKENDSGLIVLERGVDHPPPKCFSGGGGLISSAADITVFVQTMLNKGVAPNGARLMTSGSLEEMTRNQLGKSLGEFGIPDFGYVPMNVAQALAMYTVVDPDSADMRNSVGEFGWAGGASCFFWCDPIKEFAVIFLTQQMFIGDYPQYRELNEIVYRHL